MSGAPARIKHLVREVLQLFFHIYWDSVDFGIIFDVFGGALGPISMTFGALETSLKFEDFRWLSGWAQG